MPEDTPASTTFLPAETAGAFGGGACVVIVRTAEEFAFWLNAPGPEALQVEGLLADPGVWALAAQGTGQLPLDVVLDDPATEFSALYRLVDVCMVRPVRVTIPCRPGFMKALRLAAALQIPVRLLPGQPDNSILAELTAAVQFYLRDPMVEVPVEFFHSVLATLRDRAEGTLWMFLEQDPALFFRQDAGGVPIHATDFVETRLALLLSEGAECAACRWQSVCAGYFKWPDAAYDCAGVKQLFATLESAADEITRDLAGQEMTSPP